MVSSSLSDLLLESPVRLTDKNILFFQCKQLLYAGLHPNSPVTHLRPFPSACTSLFRFAVFLIFFLESKSIPKASGHSLELVLFYTHSTVTGAGESLSLQIQIV